MEIKKSVGDRIKNLRLSKSLTATKLANMSFISQSYLSDIENGRTLPALDTLFQICDALGISLGEFFGGITEPSADLIRLVENAKKLEEDEIRQLSNFIESIVRRTED